MKSNTFRTIEGQTLHLRHLWTDGNVEFYDVNGVPVDDWGEPLSGEYLDDAV